MPVWAFHGLLDETVPVEESVKMARAARRNGADVRLTIDPEAVDPDDVEMLQDMVIAAVNEAMRKAESDASASMSKLTGGMNLGF